MDIKKGQLVWTTLGKDFSVETEQPKARPIIIVSDSVNHK